MSLSMCNEFYAWFIDWWIINIFIHNHTLTHPKFKQLAMDSLKEKSMPTHALNPH